MSTFGGIQIHLFERGEKKQREDFMAEANEVLVEAAKSRNLPHGRLLRDEFKKGRCTLIHSPRARGFMLDMIALEPIVLGGWIRTVNNKIKFYHENGKDSRPGLQFSDYVQEAAMGIYDAQYSFNGSTRFSTHAWVCAKNRLLTLLRQEDKQGGISVGVRKLRKRVREIMETHSVNLDQALALVGHEINSDEFERLRSSYRLIGSIDGEGAEQGECDADKSEIVEMQDAVQRADMTDLERALINAHLDNDRRFRTELLERATQIAAKMLRERLTELRGNRSYAATLAELKQSVRLDADVVKLAMSGPVSVVRDPLARSLVNEDTFKPCTKQWLSQCFTSACEKAREVYGGTSKAA